MKMTRNLWLMAWHRLQWQSAKLTKSAMSQLSMASQYHNIHGDWLAISKQYAAWRLSVDYPGVSASPSIFSWPWRRGQHGSWPAQLWRSRLLVSHRTWLAVAWLQRCLAGWQPGQRNRLAAWLLHSWLASENQPAWLALSGMAIIRLKSCIQLHRQLANEESGNDILSEMISRK